MSELFVSYFLFISSSFRMRRGYSNIAWTYLLTFAVSITWGEVILDPVKEHLMQLGTETSMYTVIC